ncbi:hypothetical protein ETD86_23590 [Nonomuraea turkmeniaca]|uniref:Uncharacterized protein n=1 Tax=Nonomuraea turkmeniaca TaxID=103838 RepID=A0A5S4FF35_9ACTN|nr:hypothetical protein [Nonomuraea turkmeniaca]TMR17324.1 hypothetical protein ETD86_23590 [Nonomuraea turkmeniaca]
MGRVHARAVRVAGAAMTGVPHNHLHAPFALKPLICEKPLAAEICEAALASAETGRWTEC